MDVKLVINVIFCAKIKFLNNFKGREAVWLLKKYLFFEKKILQIRCLSSLLFLLFSSKLKFSNHKEAVQ